jgi:carbon-monoxide dehydrogenase medium subunit
VRHLGTIGGSVANNDPAADYPAALLALGATVVTNTREVAAEDFFTGLFETALGEGEIVTAIRFDAPQAAGYQKFRHPASRYAMAGVFVAKRGDGVKVAVTGAGDTGVFRSPEMEAALASNFDASALDGVTLSADGMMSDIHASADYRAHLVVVMARRAVTAAKG